MSRLILETPRPNRRVRLAVEAASRAARSEPVPAPAPGQVVSGHVGVAHDNQHVVLIITINGRSLPMPFTPDQALGLSGNLAEHAEAVRKGGAAAAAEVPLDAAGSEPRTEAQASTAGSSVAAVPSTSLYADEEEASAIRARIEAAANDYGKAAVPDATIHRAFRHPIHLTNWCRKHRLEMDTSDDGLFHDFYPVFGVPTVAPTPAE